MKDQTKGPKSGEKLVRVKVLQRDEPFVPATFGPYIAGLRRERRLTLREAAAEIGISNGYLSQMETGERLPKATIPLMNKIAETYERPIAEVLAAAGIREAGEPDRRAQINRAFRRLVLHPDLMPARMDGKHWLDSFSTRQKLQIIELAQRVFDWDPAEGDKADDAVLEILDGFPTAFTREDA